MASPRERPARDVVRSFGATGAPPRVATRRPPLLSCPSIEEAAAATATAEVSRRRGRPTRGGSRSHPGVGQTLRAPLLPPERNDLIDARAGRGRWRPTTASLAAASETPSGAFFRSPSDEAAARVGGERALLSSAVSRVRSTTPPVARTVSGERSGARSNDRTPLAGRTSDAPSRPVALATAAAEPGVRYLGRRCARPRDAETTDCLPPSRRQCCGRPALGKRAPMVRDSPLAG